MPAVFDTIHGHVRSILTRILNLRFTRLDFFHTIFFLFSVELLVETSDLAQIIRDMWRAHSARDFAQVAHSAYSLLSHTVKVASLFLYYHTETRRRTSVTSDTDQRLDGVDLPSPPQPALDRSGFRLAGLLESGLQVNGIWTPLTALPSMQPTIPHSPAPDVIVHTPTRQAHGKTAHADASVGTFGFTNDSIASIIPLKQSQLHTSNNDDQALKGPTVALPEPAQLRSLSIRPNTTENCSTTPSVLERKHLQNRRRKFTEPQVAFLGAATNSKLQEPNTHQGCRGNSTASSVISPRGDFHETRPHVRPSSASSYAEVPSRPGHDTKSVGDV
jgi:hypothetical protein